MNVQLPNDPVMLLSVVNTRLRDQYENLDCFCENHNIEKNKLIKILADIDYVYDEQSNQFV